MKTITEIAESFHPREIFADGRKSGDIVFYRQCVRDSEEWKSGKIKGQIVWDIHCPFCGKKVACSVKSWSEYAGFGVTGCNTCFMERSFKIKKTEAEIETNQVACFI